MYKNPEVCDLLTIHRANNFVQLLNWQRDLQQIICWNIDRFGGHFRPEPQGVA